MVLEVIFSKIVPYSICNDILNIINFNWISRIIDNMLEIWGHFIRKMANKWVLNLQSLLSCQVKEQESVPKKHDCTSIWRHGNVFWNLNKIIAQLRLRSFLFYIPDLDNVLIVFSAVKNAQVVGWKYDISKWRVILKSVEEVIRLCIKDPDMVIGRIP